MGDRPSAHATRGADLGIGRLASGDGLRAGAMLALFVYHVSLMADPAAGFDAYGPAGPVFGHLDLGLALFFVLSGYLVTRPFARAYVLGTARPSVRRYTRNRVLRIVPAFYVVAGLVLLRFGLDGTIERFGAGDSSLVQVLGIFAFLQVVTGGPAAVPVGQAWSLDAEMAFYALVPFVAVAACAAGRRFGTPRSRAGFALAVLGLAFVVSVQLRSSGPATIGYLAAPPTILYAFLPGVMLAIAEPLVAGMVRRRVRIARALAWAAGLAAVTAAVAYVASDYVDGTALHHALGRRAVLAAIFAGAVLAGLLVLQLSAGRAPRLLTTRAMGWMGARSYSFYLIHIAVLLEVQHAFGREIGVGERFAAMMVVGLPASILLAAASYHFVEQPFLERRRIRTRVRQPHPVAEREHAPTPALVTSGP